MRSRVGQTWSYGPDGEGQRVYLIVGVPKVETHVPTDYWYCMHPAIRISSEPAILHNLGESSNRTMEQSESDRTLVCRRIA